MELEQYYLNYKPLYNLISANKGNLVHSFETKTNLSKKMSGIIKF